MLLDNNEKLSEHPLHLRSLKPWALESGKLNGLKLVPNLYQSIIAFKMFPTK